MSDGKGLRGKGKIVVASLIIIAVLLLVIAAVRNADKDDQRVQKEGIGAKKQKSFGIDMGNYVQPAVLRGSASSLGDACEDDLSLPRLGDEDKEYLVGIAHRAISDFFNITSYDGGIFREGYQAGNKVFVSFRVDGIQRGSWSAQEGYLPESVYAATINTLSDVRYNGTLRKDEVDRVKIEIYILGEGKDFAFTDIEGFEQSFGKGVYGLTFSRGNESATFYNSVQIAKNYDTKKLFGQLCKKAGFAPSCYTDNATMITVFRTLHFMDSRYSPSITTFFRAHTPLAKEDLSADAIGVSLFLAQQWLFENINGDGSVNYQYSPSTGRYLDGNNAVRQFLASHLISRIAAHSDDGKILEYNLRNLNYNLRNYYREDEKNGLAYILYGGDAKLGAAALAALSIIESPHSKEFGEKGQKIGALLLASQNQNGSFQPFYIHPTGRYDERSYMRFYAGETILALAKLYSASGDRRYLDAAEKGAEYYERYVWEDYDPAFVPWMVLSLYELHSITGKQEYADAAFKFTDELVKMQNTGICPFPDELGRFYDPNHPEWGAPFAASTAVYTEGVAYAYDLARKLNDTKRMQMYRQSALLGSLNLINLQFTGPDMFYLNHPQRALGAVRYAPDDNRIRIDTTQHSIDAWMAVLEFIDEEEIALS